MADRIVNEEEGALDDYLTYLKTGSSDFPIEVMKKSQRRHDQQNYIEPAMEVFEERLDLLEEITEDL